MKSALGLGDRGVECGNLNEEPVDNVAKLVDRLSAIDRGPEPGTAIATFRVPRPQCP